MRTKDEIKAEVRALILEMNQQEINEAMERFVSAAEAWIRAYRTFGLQVRDFDNPEGSLFHALHRTRSDVLNEIHMLQMTPC